MRHYAITDKSKTGRLGPFIVVAKLLTLIASLDKHNGGVYDAIIYDQFNPLPKENINYSINELLINRLIAEGNTPKGIRFRLFYITDEGLRALFN